MYIIGAAIFVGIIRFKYLFALAKNSHKIIIKMFNNLCLEVCDDWIIVIQANVVVNMHNLLHS